MHLLGNILLLFIINHELGSFAVFFFVLSLSGCGIRIILASWNELEGVPSCSILGGGDGKSLWKIGINYSFKLLIEFIRETRFSVYSESCATIAAF